MTRLAMAPAEPAGGELKAVLDRMRAARGPGFQLPHLYRVLGLAPPMIQAWVDFAWPLREKATSPRKIRELLILRGAQVSKTDYEWAHHVPFALECGVLQAQIDALDDWKASKLFTAPERSALRLADEVALGPAASAECIDDLKRHFSDAHVVELVLTASFYVCVTRFLKSMDVQLEAGFTGLHPHKA